VGPPEGTPLVVVDTVGLADPTLSTLAQQKKLKERLASIERAAAGVARFLVVLTLGVHGRLTNDDLSGIIGLTIARPIRPWPRCNPYFVF